MPANSALEQGLWLDHQAFAKATLLPDADIPWLDAPAFAQWQAKAHGLLGKPVVLIPLADGIATWLQGHPDATQALSQAKGPMGMMRVLCAHPGFTQWLGALILNLRMALPHGQATVVMPAPAALMAMLITTVQGISTPTIDPEDAEDAAVYLANAMRAIPVDALDSLTIDVRLNDCDEPAGMATLQKVAAHYQWQFGVHAWRADSVTGLRMDFVIVDQLTHETPTRQREHQHAMGAMVDLGLAPAALATSAETRMDFIVVRLPDHIAPEQVLSQLRALTPTP